MDPTTHDPLLTLRQLAEREGLPERRIRHLCDRYGAPTYRIGTMIMVRYSEWRAWIDEHRETV